MNNAAASALKTYSRLETRGYCPPRHLTCDTSLRAELSRAKVLARCAYNYPLQAVSVVRNPIGAYMKFCGATRSVAELAGAVARQRFLSQLG
jgi:hypothetical protein